MKVLTNKVKLASMTKTLMTSLTALFFALFITGLLIAACGYNPIEIYTKVFAESFSSRASIALCLSQATPLIFAGLSFMVGLKVGLINVGVEGQLVTGAMVAALCGIYIDFLPSFLHVSVCVILAACAGGLVNLFTTYLKVKTDAPEVITGIMLNTILSLFASYLINGPLKPDGATIGKTAQILPTAELTRIVPRTQLTTAFILAIIIAIILHVVLNRTVFGYKIRVTGLNKRASVVAGIKSSSVYYSTSFISGAIAGIAGASVALGVYRCYMENLSVGYGFAGIPVAALAGYAPLAIPVAGILFGILKAGTMTLSRTTSVPMEIVSIIQALVVVFVSAPAMVTSFTKLKAYKKLKESLKSKKNLTPVKVGDADE